MNPILTNIKHSLIAPSALWHVGHWQSSLVVPTLLGTLH